MTEAMNYTPDMTDPNRAVQAAVDNKETAVEVDFSQVGPELAIRYLLSRLRDPQHAHLRGDALARTVVSLTSADDDADTSSHEGRMEELRRMPIDEQFWDKKSAEDPVFALLERYLRTQQARSLTEPRLAARHLYALRASFTDMTTTADDEWVDVIERLFPQP
ncbi:TPA: hypothetical protein DCF80_00195 [Candidatus Saccharibacteria bacterium]|nr:hypothetical protein [Candidatus Saccharibacteria bacterium]HRK41070.1 hypothetical protein [Candidatus Saccharibacteria bacterium]